MKDDDTVDEACDLCGRLHRTDMPCPKRIASAFMMQVKGLENLTNADMAWVQAHQDFDCLAVIEEAIAEKMA